MSYPVINVSAIPRPNPLNCSAYDSELVSPGIGEHHPYHVRSLAQVDMTSTERDQSVELFSRDAADAQRVDAEPAFASFGLRWPEDADAESHAIRRTDRLVGPALVEDSPAEVVAPEQRQRLGAYRIDAQDSRIIGDPSKVADPPEPLMVLDRLKPWRSRAAQWSPVATVHCERPKTTMCPRSGPSIVGETCSRGNARSKVRCTYQVGHRPDIELTQHSGGQNLAGGPVDDGLACADQGSIYIGHPL